MRSFYSCILENGDVLVLPEMGDGYDGVAVSWLADEDEEVARTAVFSLYEILGMEYIKKLLQSGDLQECCVEEINDLLIESQEVEIERND